MVRSLSIAGALAGLCLAGSGCVVRGQVRTAAYVEPEPVEADLVMVQPGVYVIADYDQPVFYSDGYYWLYGNGYWSRSYTYTGGWTRVRGVPYNVRRINRPHAYVHYRARGNVHYYRAPSRRGEAPRRVERRNNVRRDRVERRDHRRDDHVERRDHRTHR
ncbi:MAG TPA: hypothetical protein VK698_23005 [Kofleriaceae bacterium]|nr:hypothetical protein [Kofleriaceae bacterium]